MVKEFDSFLEHHLGASQSVSHQTALSRHGLRADLLLRDADQIWVVGSSRALPKSDDIARLAMMRQLIADEEANKVEGVLVVPAASDTIRALADRMGIRIIIAPMELLPDNKDAKDRVPLTSPASWSVVVELLRKKEIAGLTRLGREAGVSLAWTHRVVAYLESVGVIHRTTGKIRIIDEPRLLGFVATERSLDSLRVATIETGQSNLQDMLLLLNTQLKDPKHEENHAFALCGLTAATCHGVDYLEENQARIYSEHPHAIKRLFQGKKGGITILVHRPDRELSAATEKIQGTSCVNQKQAFLDVLGEGGRYWDSAHQLLEMIRSG